MKKNLALILLMLWGALGAWAEGPWETISNPETNKGLVLSMRMVQFRGRVYMFWGGTSGPVLAPEVFFSTRSDGESDWTVSRAPFFGKDLGRVRRLTAATARDMMVILFERESTQGGGAIEVLLAVSPDTGYTWNLPFVMDSFVLGDSNGSSVAAAARQGTKRPEFACAWVAETGTVRMANVDPRSGYRPEAISVGDVADLQAKVEIVGAGANGFYGVWPEQGGLKTAHIKPLTGGTEPMTSLAKGNFGKAWCACSHYRGPGAVVAATDTISTLQIDGDKFQKTTPEAKNVILGRNVECRSAMDEDKNIHMMLVNDHKVWYMTNKGGQWSAPEPVMELDPNVPITGYDIVATEEFVYIGVGQRQLLKMSRRKLPGK